MHDFVSGRGSNRHEHAVTVHEFPFPFQLLGRNLLYPFHHVERTASANRLVSLAEQARLEHEAELKRKAETKAEASQKRRTPARGAFRFSLSPADGGTHETEWREYETPRSVVLAREEYLREALAQVAQATQVALVRAAFETIVKPNAKDRRRLQRLLARLNAE